MLKKERTQSSQPERLRTKNLKPLCRCAMGLDYPMGSGRISHSVHGDVSIVSLHVDWEDGRVLGGRILGGRMGRSNV